MTDARTLETMRRIYTEHGLLVDPHTAVGCAAAWDHLAGDGHPDREQVIVLSTAHPGKFSDIVREGHGRRPRDARNGWRDASRFPSSRIRWERRCPSFPEFLLDSFA